MSNETDVKNHLTTTPDAAHTVASVLSQAGPDGIRYDFQDGCRVFCPPGHDWRVVMHDRETRNILFNHTYQGGYLRSSRRSFVLFGLEVFKNGRPVFAHDYNAAGRDVLIDMSLGALGDHLAWMGQVERFRQKHGCRLTCIMRGPLIDLLAAAYPEIRMVSKEQCEKEGFYAAYKVAVFYNDDAGYFQPCDYRQVGLCATAAWILGLPPQEIRPAIPSVSDVRPIEKPYVCIAVQASGQAKYWNNPRGWREVVTFLKQAGYEVICIDKLPENGSGLTWTTVPNGVRDETGDRPLAERAWWLHHAEFFIGLSSGLAWLAWAVKCRVVMISGFTEMFNEFQTPWRVINKNVCNGCANDVRLKFDSSDFFWCPRHKGTSRQFECTRMITAHQVISHIDTLRDDIKL